MTGYDPATYGDTWAEDYDRLHPTDLAAEAAAALVAVLARGGPVLELAIGTGRLALPLAGRGVEVHGIDASAAMVERLRAKPGGAALPVTIGDMTETVLEREFRVVLLAFNTLFALPDQARQVACFTNAARHLAADGVFVVEAFVPDLGRFDRGQRVQTAAIGADAVHLEVAQHDPVRQSVHSAMVEFGTGGTRILPVDIRYAWPSELDLMARLAGLRLRERWAGWEREPFTAASPGHVSVYEPDP